VSENRQILIKSLPTGRLEASDYELRGGPTPDPGPDEVLVRTLVLTIGAGQRAGLQGSASYAGAPKTGVVMGGQGVGRVEASNAAGINPGDLVTGMLGWQDYAAMPAKNVRVVDAEIDPALHVSVLGLNGITAYFGLLDVGRPRPGDTVVVSAASGSVGHLVGQLARRLGCRVVGVTGSDEKAARLRDELGFEATVNHRAASFVDDLKEATPDRIGVYFDNTGGDILAACLRRMKVHGTIACCGAVSQYDTNDPEPGPRGIPGLLVNNRVRMEGFLVFDYADRYDEARSQLRSWVEAGELQSWHHEVDGLDAAPQAFVDLLAGANMGTTIVRVAT
jgi:NADPH-dependent curcumin reductase CurA